MQDLMQQVNFVKGFVNFSKIMSPLIFQMITAVLKLFLLHGILQAGRKFLELN